MDQDHPFDTLSFDDEVTPIHAGPALVRVEGEEPAERYAEVNFRWLPSPRITQTITLESSVAVMMHALDEQPPTIERVAEWLRPSTPISPPQGAPRMNAQSIHEVVLGDDCSVDEVRICVLNLRAALAPIGPDDMRFDLGPWVADLVVTSGAADAKDHLAETSLFALTHLLRIRRQDGATFEYRGDGVDEDINRVISSLWHSLSFMNGTLVGFALPCGYRDGGLTWCRASVTTCDRGSFCLTWSDPHHFVKQAQELVPAFYVGMGDAFLRKVLPRIVRMTSDANNPSPLDTAVPTAQAGLELLAWAVLVEREDWLRRDAGLDAAGRIRLLLRWAGIDSAVPADFEALLAARPSGMQVTEFDGPRAVTLVRRDVIHPPKSGDWPDAEAIEQAWRLSLTYLELATLRLLGYGGTYASRHVLEGRWIGTVAPVPWTEGAASTRG